MSRVEFEGTIEILDCLGRITCPDLILALFEPGLGFEMILRKRCAHDSHRKHADER